MSLPVLGAGLLTCVLLEKLRLFGYGALMPEPVRQVLAAYAAEDDAARTRPSASRCGCKGLQR